MLSTIFRPALVKRFSQSVREEGFGQAARKTRAYLTMVLRNRGRTALSAAGSRMQSNEHYMDGIWQELAKGEAFHVLSAPAALSRNRKIALIGDLNLPQCRKYRIEQLAEFWQSRGVDIVHAHYQDLPRCVNAMQDATHLFEYRLQSGPLMAMYRYEARRLRLPVLYDLDDPLFSVSAYESYSNMSLIEPELKAHFLAEAPKYLEAMNGSDILTVSTPGMADHARLYTRRPVHIRRNFADAVTLAEGQRAIETRGSRETGQPFRVVFASGSRGHEADFAIIQDQVVAFLDGAANRRLMILGHFDERLLPESLRGRIEKHAFSTYDAYLRILAQADCALMPLTDDIFNQCKSAVRVIDASAVGVPSIVGTVGDMCNVTVDGRTGLVVKDGTGWLRALETLAGDRDQAAEMGRSARRDIETRWAGGEGAHIVSPDVIEWVKG